MNQFRCKKSRPDCRCCCWVYHSTHDFKPDFAQGYRYKSADSWAFGVMGDTQWTPGLPEPRRIPRESTRIS